jgi:hypothetical protein
MTVNNRVSLSTEREYKLNRSHNTVDRCEGVNRCEWVDRHEWVNKHEQVNGWTDVNG